MGIVETRITVYVLLGSLLAMSGRASGQEQSSAASAGPNRANSSFYGPLQAGQQAYQHAEAERRAALAQQLETISRMAWWDSRLRGPRTPPSLESFYAYPGASRTTWYGTRTDYPTSAVYRDYRRWDVFEPWPLVAGDIFGYPQVDRVAQPVGHEIVDTGPNSYVYRPIYAGESRPTRAVPWPSKATPPPPVPHPPTAATPLSDAPERNSHTEEGKNPIRQLPGSVREF